MIPFHGVIKRPYWKMLPVYELRNKTKGRINETMYSCAVKLPRLTTCHRMQVTRLQLSFCS